MRLGAAVRMLAIAVVLALVATSAGSSDKKVGADCTYKGFKLYGKVKIVSSFPDLKIQTVQSFPDLKVKHVEHFPDSCGKWQFVENFPDLKVQYVDAFPDLKIQFVENFPGLP